MSPTTSSPVRRISVVIAVTKPRIGLKATKWEYSRVAYPAQFIPCYDVRFVSAPPPGGCAGVTMPRRPSRQGRHRLLQRVRAARQRPSFVVRHGGFEDAHDAGPS